jgi:hypothetical protein
MAINAPRTAQNFSTGNYWRIIRAELVCGPDDPVPQWVVHVGFYANAAARQAFSSPMWVEPFFFPFSETVPDPRADLYPLLLAHPFFANTNAASDEVSQ